ncbi:hypothetical protein PMAYCL1PPCAC_11963, partial [Pristionchus mayeri]
EGVEAEMVSQYAYGECTQQNSGQMPYYAAPRGFNTVAEHIKAGQAVEHIPHRLFVGGFGAQVTEKELREHFERFYTIRDVKVIKNHEGMSKGYGFITFDTEEEAKAVQALSNEKLTLNGKKLNLGPALRKMVHSRYNNSTYDMNAMPTGQYNGQQQCMQSPTMQFTYSYASPPQTGTPYMMGYAPQGMVPVSHSLSTGDDSSQSMEKSGGEKQLQQMQHVQQPPSLLLQPGVQNTPQTLYSYYVPPPTPMTPTFRAFPYAPLYGPPQTPQMIVDGAALYPQQMMSPPMMFSYYPPTPSMDASFPGQSPAAPPVDGPPPQTLLQQLQQHYPPLREEEGGELDGQNDHTGMGSIPKQVETSMGDIRLSYATIAAKLKSQEVAAAKEVEQISTQMGSMKMNGAGGDYTATTKNGVHPRV